LWRRSWRRASSRPGPRSRAPPPTARPRRALRRRRAGRAGGAPRCEAGLISHTTEAARVCVPCGAARAALGASCGRRVCQGPGLLVRWRQGWVRALLTAKLTVWAGRAGGVAPELCDRAKCAAHGPWLRCSWVLCMAVAPFLVKQNHQQSWCGLER